jgi:hypothetical protein
LYGDSQKEFIGELVAFRVNAVIADHFEMFIGDVDDKFFDKVSGSQGFGYEMVIFMPVVMKRNRMAVIMINAGGGDNGPSQISADVFDQFFWVGQSRFGVDVEAVGAIFVNVGFNLFEGFTEMLFHMVQEGGAERTAEEGVIEMLDCTPNSLVAGAAFGKKDMNMRVPFEVPAEGVKDANEAWGKMLGFIHLKKHARNNIAYSVKQAIQQLPVFTEIRAEFLGDGENTVAVFTVNQLKGHGG